MLLEAIESERFSGDVFGLPVISSESGRATTLDLGFGPTRVEFDDQGYSYIGSFVDSIVWKIAMGEPYAEQHGREPWTTVETLDAHYSVVHPLIPGGDTAAPYGQYLVMINKFSKNTFVPHGPLHAENHELYNISEIPGGLIDQMPLGPETHGAQALPVALLEPLIISSYALSTEREDPRVEYDYTNQQVNVYMNVVRSSFYPDWFTAPQGWRVNIHMTSIEQTNDISHGLGIDGFDIAVSLDPGEVREVEFTAEYPGVHWFYCLWYCSELHKEMRGRMIVIPQDDWSAEMEWIDE
jgi:nitrous-oxide reductase